MRRAFDLQGHRGARGLFPENTLEGFAAALAIGVTTFELDVAMTADGVPVVSHDAAFNPDLVRRTDGTWITAPGPLIRTLRLADLATYDVGRLRPGSAYAAPFADQRPHDGARIPRLADALAVDPVVRFNIEMKTYPDHPDWTVPPERMAEAVIAVAEQIGVTDRITVESFDWRGPRHVRRVRPNYPLAWLTRPGNRNTQCRHLVGWSRRRRLWRLHPTRRGGGGRRHLGAAPCRPHRLAGRGSPRTRPAGAALDRE